MRDETVVSVIRDQVKTLGIQAGFAVFVGG